MALPPLVLYDTPTEYREHYQNNYCRNNIATYDGIRIFFSQSKFEHAFYESDSSGRKNIFSKVRAERIDWIKETVQNPNSQLFTGWNKVLCSYQPSRRVALLHEQFVVVVEMSVNNSNTMVGKFVTCYQADASVGKIIAAPTWSYEACLKELKK